MRLFAIGLLAAVMMAAVSPVSAFAADKAKPVGDAKSHKQGMADVPALIQETGVHCTPVDAYFVGQGKSTDASGKQVNTKLYEVACQEGLGWMLFKPDAGPATALDCLASNARKPKPGEKDTGQIYCRLPQNQNPEAGLQPILSQAGVANCTVKQGRWVGSSADGKLDEYEALCTDGTDYVLQVPRAGSPQKLVAANCLDEKVGDCQFFPKEAYLAKIASMAQPANRPCQITDARYVGTTPDKKNYYEIACSDQKSGYMLEVDAAGHYVSAIDCGKAANIADGCTLTSAAAAQTAENSTYTTAAKEIGFNCDVTSYHGFGTDTKTGREVVELACAGHPESYVALLPVDKGQTGEYLDCVRAQDIGLKCVLTPIQATYAKFTQLLQGAGKSCQVQDARNIGATAAGDSYVEVECSTGPGYVLDFAPHGMTVKSAVTCPIAKTQGLDCSLPHWAGSH